MKKKHDSDNLQVDICSKDGDQKAVCCIQAIKINIHPSNRTRGRVELFEEVGVLGAEEPRLQIAGGGVAGVPDQGTQSEDAIDLAKPCPREGRWVSPSVGRHLRGGDTSLGSWRSLDQRYQPKGLDVFGTRRANPG